MVSEECSCASLAQVPCEHARLRSPEIDYDQPVESVAELVVGAESEKTPTQLQVLLEEGEQALRLARARAEMDVGKKQRSDPVHCTP